MENLERTSLISLAYMLTEIDKKREEEKNINGYDKMELLIEEEIKRRMEQEKPKRRIK